MSKSTFEIPILRSIAVIVDLVCAPPPLSKKGQASSGVRQAFVRRSFPFLRNLRFFLLLVLCSPIRTCQSFLSVWTVFFSISKLLSVTRLPFLAHVSSTAPGTSVY